MGWRLTDRGEWSDFPADPRLERTRSPDDPPIEGALVSLILCVRNGMPYLREAIESVAAQTYRDFELIVQDGASADGTLEYLGEVAGLPRIDIVSQPDGGLGEAYNRAVQRCSGAIIGTIDADNVLEPDALQCAVSFLTERPELAAAYGGSNMLDADGALLYPWMPGEFELLRLLQCELVPPFAVSFFSRAVCGEELRFDQTMKMCADFDLWLRLSHLPIARMPFILGGTRLSNASTSRRADTYEQQIADKTAALDRYFSGLQPCALVTAVHRRSLAGLHLWAAESIYDIEGRRTAQFERYLGRARDLDPGSRWAERVADLALMRPEPEVPNEPTAEPEPDEDDHGPMTIRHAAMATARRLGLRGE